MTLNLLSKLHGGGSQLSRLLSFFTLLHLLILKGSGVSGLSCYRCGDLSNNARSIVDCSGVITVEQCSPDEACVVFKRLYIKGSESIRGCYPVNQTLPGLSGSLIPSRPECVFLPKTRSPVKVCMCTDDLCNANDYNIHTERANLLFSDQNSNTISSNRTHLTVTLLDGDDTSTDPSPFLSMNSVGDLSSSKSQFTKVVNKVLREGAAERVEVLWVDDRDSSRRTPRQIRQQAPRFGVPPVLCQSLNVLGATYANCDGQYTVTSERVDWAPNRPVYRHVNKDRYIFWNAHGLGWSIGKRDYLTTGSHWHRSGLDTEEPWQGTWSGGVFVECVGKQEEEEPPVTRAPTPQTSQAVTQPPASTNQQSKGPTHCVWSGFGEWSRCSVSCGSGTQQRKRMVLQPARNGGQECIGDAVESRPCSQVACPVDCEWTDFDEWTVCSASCSGGIQRRRRTVAVRASNGGQPCRGRDVESRACNEDPCPNSCCSRIVVKAFGAAKNDQSLYLGTYNQITTYNGKAAFEKEGSDQLYVYFFTSQSDQLSLWVIGPELGKFIAGIRNDGSSGCVQDVTEPWRYASRAGIWKEDDPTLQVKCYSPEDDVDSLAFGVRKTTTKLPVSNKNNQAQNQFSQEDDLEEDEAPVPPPVSSLDCQWSEYGPWSSCSASCDRGTQTRFRTILQREKFGGKSCQGSAKDSRSCNLQSCFNEIATTSRRPIETTTTFRQPQTTTTSRQPPTTTTSHQPPATTTTRPRPVAPRIDGRVKCFACGSLFSTDAPDCQKFDFNDPSQQKTCETGEACLWYTYLKSENERAVIRECLSTSILLGSIENPIEPQEQCNPQSVEDDDDSIIACICTEDFCNGYKDESIEPSNSKPVSQKPAAVVTTQAPRTTTVRIQTPRTTTTTERPRRPAPAPEPVQEPRPSSQQVALRGQNSDPNKVLCHQCGTLFSGSSGNTNCTEFDSSRPEQTKYCKPGEACLWYSWQKSENEISTIRECFSPSILLGPITNPLTVKSECEFQDISETPGSSIMACLCDSDLCNSRDFGKGEPVALAQIGEQPASSRQRTTTTTRTTTRPPVRTTTTPLPARRPISQTPPDADDLSPEELVALTEFGRVQNGVPEEPKSRPQPAQNKPVVTPRPPGPKPAASTGGGLRCFSCGSLLDPNRQCDTFNPADATQLQTCGPNEACLLYTWKKSATETAVLRECFPISVLLGDFNDPLTPEDECRPRDISDADTSGVTACLCSTSFCNSGDAPIGDLPPPDLKSVTTTTQRNDDRFRTTTVRTEPVTTSQRLAQGEPPRRTQPLTEPKREPVRIAPQVTPTSCPRGFELVGFGCYSFSKDRMGWIEAKKMCELKNSRLIVIETEKERDDILEFLISTEGRQRSRFEFWTAGNDIESENVWIWSGQGDEIVPDFGWIEQPLPSAEENCLTWDITVTRGTNRGRQISGSSGQRFTEGWHSDSCCNSVRYICELA